MDLEPLRKNIFPGFPRYFLENHSYLSPPAIFSIGSNVDMCSSNFPPSIPTQEVFWSTLHAAYCEILEERLLFFLLGRKKKLVMDGPYFRGKVNRTIFVQHPAEKWSILLIIISLRLSLSIYLSISVTL